MRSTALGAVAERNPVTARRASIGAIGAGITVFVVASITAPFAGADDASHPGTHQQPRRYIHYQPVGAASVPTAVPTTSAPARRTVTSKAILVAHTATTDPTVISGLAANGIPRVALNAYRVAAARMAAVEPSCGVDWALLAGIGREESDHGQFAGAVLHADGISTPPIIGPALTGVHGDYIPAPANGLALDGDAVYAHALGPMQFIPSTWAIYGTDGDGDGHANIFDINDAALSAARYLCAAGGNLRTHAGQVAGVLSYNHSDEYLAQVLALADAYRHGLNVTGIPVVGITRGKLTKVQHTGYIPPVNPGVPTAVAQARLRREAALRRQLAEQRARASAAASKPASSTPPPKSSSTAPSKPGSSQPPTSAHPTGTPTQPPSSALPTCSSSSPSPSASSSSPTGTPSPLPTCSTVPGLTSVSTPSDSSSFTPGSSSLSSPSSSPSLSSPSS